MTNRLGVIPDPESLLPSRSVVAEDLEHRGVANSGEPLEHHGSHPELYMDPYPCPQTDWLKGQSIRRGPEITALLLRASCCTTLRLQTVATSGPAASSGLCCYIWPLQLHYS